MSEIDSCVRIFKSYCRFRKFIAAFSTIFEVNFFSANFAFGHPPRNLSLGSGNYFYDSFFPRSISDSPAQSVWKSLKNCQRFRNFKTSVAREIRSFSISTQDYYIRIATITVFLGLSARVLGDFG